MILKNCSEDLCHVIVNTNLIEGTCLDSMVKARQQSSASFQHPPLTRPLTARQEASSTAAKPGFCQTQLSQSFCVLMLLTRPCSVRHSQRYFHDWSLLGHNWCPLLSRRRLSRHCCSWKKSRWNNRCGQTAPSLYLHVLIGTRQRAHPNSS